jgi:TM2 domain-containing membrane protein YozV
MDQNPAQTESNRAVSTPGEFWTVLLLCLFTGGLSLHRFYAGKTGSALLQIVTLGGLGFWLLYDLVTILMGSFQNQKGMVYKNPQPWLSLAIVVVLISAGVEWQLHLRGMNFPLRYQGGQGRQAMSQAELNSFSSSVDSTNAVLQQMFTDYAKQHFGRDATVEFAGPGTNGAYQVTVHMRANYGGIQTSEYSVTLGAAGTNIDAWR